MHQGVVGEEGEGRVSDASASRVDRVIEDECILYFTEWQENIWHLVSAHHRYHLLGKNWMGVLVGIPPNPYSVTPLSHITTQHSISRHIGITLVYTLISALHNLASLAIFFKSQPTYMHHTATTVCLSPPGSSRRPT
jgi:hypothetical protein